MNNMKSFKFIKHRAHTTNKPKVHTVLDHILASFLPLTGLSISLALGSIAEKSVILIFMPIIVASAWIGGPSAGILTTIISVILLNYENFLYFLNQNIFDISNVMFAMLFTAEGIILSFMIDTLKHRERIKAYKKKEKELDKQISTLENSIKNYKKEIKTRDEFLSIASHELKTPLTSMLLQTQSALHNIKNVSVAKFSFENLLKMLASVENQTQRLSRMINDLLSVSIITSGHLELEIENVNLNKLINGIIDDFDARFKKDNIKANFRSSIDIKGRLDRIRIEQAISNLVSNAIKYGGGKSIEIYLEKNRKNAEITVKDYGIGISHDKQRNIFELFSRGVPTEHYKGLGIGLFITQKIVNAHGGKIEVKSKLGRGSIFKIILPINDSAKTDKKTVNKT